MNPLANINPVTGSGVQELQSLLTRPQGAQQTQAFEQTLANVLGGLMSQTSSTEATGDGDEAPVVPTGSSLQPLQLALILSQVKAAQ